MNLGTFSETQEEPVIFRIKDFAHLKERLGSDGRYANPVHQVTHTRVQVDDDGFAGRDLAKLLKQRAVYLERRDKD